MLKTFLASSFALAALLTSVTSAAQAAPVSRFASTHLEIKTPQGIEHVHAEIARSRAPDAPVIVLVNGLIFDLHRWDETTDRLIDSGATVIRFALYGQPENLRLLEKGKEPAFFAHGLEVKDLAGEVDQVVSRLVRGNTSVHIVGLSYGAPIAAEYARLYPARVQTLTLLSPLVVSLENYEPNGQALRTWLNSIRFWENAPCDFYGYWNPYLCTAHDYWYDAYYNSLYSTYLQGRVTTIPDGVEASVYKKSVFHLVRAVRDIDLRTDATKLRNVHVILAGNEDKPLRADQERLWAALPKSERRSLTVVKSATHALPEDAPEATARLLKAIADGRADMQDGRTSVVP